MILKKYNSKQFSFINSNNGKIERKSFETHDWEENEKGILECTCGALSKEAYLKPIIENGAMHGNEIVFKIIKGEVECPLTPEELSDYKNIKDIII